MILTSVVLKLQSLENAVLPASHGRLLHAAFLHYVQKNNPQLSEILHDNQQKMFSLGLLQFKNLPQNSNYIISEGDVAYWRLGGIGQELADILSKINKNYIFRFGKSNFKVLGNSFAGGNSYQWITFSELQLIGEKMKAAERITIEFNSAATFRYYNNDYPFPKPELVFGSLAEQWNNYSSETTFDVGHIKNIAASYLIPDNWQGETKRIDFGKGRAVTGFVGKFSYRLNLLPFAYRAVFITLTQFAYFVGVGRLNAQGCGQINILMIK